jgi:hypothetical protein
MGMHSGGFHVNHVERHVRTHLIASQKSVSHLHFKRSELICSRAKDDGCESWFQGVTHQKSRVARQIGR